MSARTVLAVFGHPDDAELVCFGTLALLAEEGHHIEIVTMTNGSGSSSRRSPQRPIEAKDAAAIIGAEVTVEAFTDGAVGADRDVYSCVEEHLRRTRPRLVLTHFVSPDDHQDHEATGRVVTAVARRHPGVRYVLHAEPPTAVGGFEPNVYVDITAQLPTKIEAVSRYRSEAAKPFMRPDAVRQRASWWAWQSAGRATLRRRYCEPFRLVKAMIDGHALLGADGPAALTQARFGSA